MLIKTAGQRHENVRPLVYAPLPVGAKHVPLAHSTLAAVAKYPMQAWLLAPLLAGINNYNLQMQIISAKSMDRRGIYNGSATCFSAWGHGL